MMELEHPRLLAVFAHPDDETFGPGGTLAHYARRGVQVYLICATRGEAGNVPKSLLHKGAAIAQLREAELRCAAYHLGLSEVIFLNYRDSGMAGSADNRHPRALSAAPLEQVAAEITHYMRLIKPQVVITFDPSGTYHHPDHIAIHRATVKAFHDASDPTIFADGLSPYQPQKLYYSTLPMKALRFLVRLMPLLGQDPRRWGRNKDIDLLNIIKDEYPIHARIKTNAVRKIRDRAVACHASQLDAGLRRPGLLGWLSRMGIYQDTFMRAFPSASADVKEDDLFAGVNL
jgi:mycothiol S-conjugate amidase